MRRSAKNYTTSLIPENVGDWGQWWQGAGGSHDPKQEVVEAVVAPLEDLELIVDLFGDGVGEAMFEVGEDAFFPYEPDGVRISMEGRGAASTTSSSNDYGAP